MEKAIARGLPVQLSHSMVPKVQVSDTRRSCSEVRGRTRQSYRGVEGLQHRGTEGDEGSRASCGNSPAEGIDIGADGVFERQDGNRDIQTIHAPEAEAILGESFLEPRLLRNDDRDG